MQERFCLFVFFGGLLFSCVFGALESGLGTLWGIFFDQKAVKSGLREDLRRALKWGPKQMCFLSGWNLEKWAPVEARAWFWVLRSSRKGFHFGVVLVPPFRAFGVSYRRKHGFQGCLIFVPFLLRLLHHFKHPKWSPKSCKMQIHFWNHFLPIRRRPVRDVCGTLSPRNPPLFYSSITQRPLRFAALPVI